MPKLSSRRGNRLSGYNYSTNGTYYITICANNRKCIFGEIKNEKCVGASPSPTYLGRIIGSFKSRCAVDYLKYIRKHNLNVSAKIWQRNYHDHIVRNDQSLNNIRQYIRNNLLTWDTDIENPNKISK